MDQLIFAIVIAANIISIATGIIILITFFATFKKTDFRTKRNMVIGAFVFIVLDPILVLLLANVLSASAGAQVLDYGNFSSFFLLL